MRNNYFNSTNPYDNSSMYGVTPNTYSPMTTNVIRVTSLDEAIMRTTKCPSDMVYFNQDKDEFYNVKLDYDGRKTWATFPYALPNPDMNTPASRADLALLTERIVALESKIGGNVDAESNG